MFGGERDRFCASEEADVKNDNGFMQWYFARLEQCMGVVKCLLMVMVRASF